MVGGNDADHIFARIRCNLDHRLPDVGNANRMNSKGHRKGALTIVIIMKTIAAMLRFSERSVSAIVP